jgi:hypothetical protein
MQGKTSSELTRERQNQTLYANYAIQKQRFQNGCSTRIQLTSGSGADNASSVYTNIVEGAALTTEEQQTIFLQANACPAPPSPPPPPSGVGSMSFSTGNYVSFANDSSLRIGSSSFTIEWWQYNTGENSFPRVFSIGSYDDSDTSIAVSYESGTFYLWTNMSANDFGSTPNENEWVHVAIVGTSGNSITIYVNGSELDTVSGAYNFTDNTTALMIGNETTPSNIANYTGKLTNFRWVVGTAVYTAPFTPPTSPLTAISGTQLLLLSSASGTVVTDSSPAVRTATNTGVTYSADTPF